MSQPEKRTKSTTSASKYVEIDYPAKESANLICKKYQYNIRLNIFTAGRPAFFFLVLLFITTAPDLNYLGQ